MFRRWRSASVLVCLAGAFFFTPQMARAQFLFGGGGLFGRPMFSPYFGPANRYLWNPYGYGMFGGGYGMFGGYGGYGGYGMPFGSGYMAGSYLNYPISPANYGYMPPQPQTSYMPGMMNYNPWLSMAALSNPGTTGLPASTSRVRESLYSGTPRMRPTLAPAVAVIPGNNTARLEILVPTADAQVWVQGVKTTQTGTDRQFVSPPLAPGSNYTYTVRARWRGAGGRMVTQTRQVSVTPGRSSQVDFTLGE